MPEINKPTILRHIAASDLTAVEKRYLEGLVNTSEPVQHGRWMRDDRSGELYCSRCKWIPSWDDEKYCANCGSKMDGGAV